MLERARQHGLAVVQLPDHKTVTEPAYSPASYRGQVEPSVKFRAQPVVATLVPKDATAQASSRSTRFAEPVGAGND
jgi:hypothetical protein